MHALLKQYTILADMIADTFGPSCEVCIHDLTCPQTSVVYVVNGSVTGREEGQSFNHLIKNVLLNKSFHNDYVANYTFEANNKKIKSSSALIRDTNGQVIGMLCINYDLTLTVNLQKQLDYFCPKNLFTENNTVSSTNIEEESDEINSILDRLIDNTLAKSFSTLNGRKENLSIIDFMDKKGVFQVKGAIDKVALKMGISKVTIYSYLDEIHKSK